MANPASSSFTTHSPVKNYGDAHMSFASAPGMSFAHPSQGQLNGAQTSKSPYRSFQDSSRSQPSAPPFRSDKPQIYTAIYSGVKVYEMEVNGIACMRRRADGWLNATQILKVAGVDKGKRTKVLEKEIHIGEHEKRQGGYGRYQGTWISYDRGVQFCRQYGVEDLMRPLLEYDRDGDGLEANQTQDTPTKEQAMAANRKRMYNTGVDNRNGVASNGTFFSNISPMSSVALSAMEKAARLNDPAPRANTTSRQSMHNAHRQSVQSASQQSLQSEHSFGGDMSLDASFANGVEPPRKRMRTDDHRPSLPVDVSMRSGTPTEPNESFVYQQASFPDPNYDGPPITMPPLPAPDTPDAEEKRAMLMDLFADQARIDYSTHPALTQLNPEDYDLPLDASANTALHWAATLARVPLVKLLLQKGANIWRGNAAGQSALVSAVLVNNCSEHSCFPYLLELLSPLIEVRDAQGRTILHHIAVACGIKGRAPSSKYYLEALLEYLVRSATHNLSGQSSQEGAGIGAVQSSSGPMSLMKFLSTIVNAQDKGGNTALNLVARIGNRSIIQQLLEIRADPSVPNHKGVSARDFGVGVDEGYNGDMMSFSQSVSNALAPSQNADRPSQTTNVDGDESMANASIIEEQNQDVISSLTSLLQSNLQNHKTLLQQKMAQIDALTTQIQELSSQQAAEMQRFNDLKDKTRLREEREKKIENLSRLLQSSQQPTSTRPVGSADDTISKQYRLPQSADKLSPASLRNLPLQQLRAITRGYERNNAQLSQESQTLKSKSLDLERMYRRVICLCTSVAEEKVDEMLSGLVAAVESEGATGPISLPQSQTHASQNSQAFPGAQDGIPQSSQQSQRSHMAQDGSQLAPAAGMGGLGVGRVREFLALVEGVNSQSPPIGMATGPSLLSGAGAGASQGLLAGVGAFATSQGTRVGPSPVGGYGGHARGHSTASQSLGAGMMVEAA